MISNWWEHGINCLYNYLEKFNFSNLILRGYILAVMHFVTQFTHTLRDFEVQYRKQKQFFRKNCLENVVSDLWKEKLMCPQKCFQKKVQKLKETKN